MKRATAAVALWLGLTSFVCALIAVMWYMPAPFHLMAIAALLIAGIVGYVYGDGA